MFLAAAGCKPCIPETKHRLNVEREANIFGIELRLIGIITKVSKNYYNSKTITKSFCM